MTSRSRASAKQAGARFEREIADHLAAHVNEFIDRQPKTGAKDKGDVANVRTFNNRKVAVECKNEATVKLGTWQKEAEVERVNLSAVASVVVHKRHGVGAPGDQWVTATVNDLIALLTGKRPGE